MINSIKHSFAVVILFIFSGLLAPVEATDWSKTFIEGVNSIDKDGEIKFESSARLNNAPENGELPAKKVEDKGKACYPSGESAIECIKSNKLAKLPEDRVSFSQCKSNSNNNIGPPSHGNPTIDISQGEYGDVKLENGSDRTIRFTTPDGIYKLKTLQAKSGRLELSSGQYWIGDLEINHGVTVVFPASGTVSFFIKGGYDIENDDSPSDPTRFLIYSYDDLKLMGGVNLNAYLVGEDDVLLEGNSTLNGAVASEDIELKGGAVINFISRTDEINVVPNCDATVQDANFQFGKAASGTVIFETPFAAGVTPLVFVMPTITNDDPNDNDGPASVFLTNVSNTGFSWSKREPVTPWWQPDLLSQPMAEVHWVATTAGEHQFSNGTKFEAGFKNTKDVLYKNLGKYKKVSLSQSYDVVLNQIQSSENNCWLTSTVTRDDDDDIFIGMDVSEVVDAGSGNGYGNKYCQPADIKLNRLKNEKVAYLALEKGVGTISLNGKDVQYHFGSDIWTLPSGSVGDADDQCGYPRPLIGFNHPPTFVAGKHSRYGNNGGWLRRCVLTKNTVSMVVDEDLYQDDERDHTAEQYGFVALEIIDDTPELECFNDDFNRDDLGDDWAIKTLGSSTSPAIASQRMRITPARGNQATSSTYQRLFPAADNFVQVEFDYFAWSPQSGTGGDGVAIILSDASITPQPGSFGGALGYAQRNNGTAGFAGGWIGVGLDEYGNFSSPNEGKVDGPGFRAQSVAIRGSVNSGYMYLAGTKANLNPAIDVRGTNTAEPNHRYRITVDSTEVGQALVLVERDIKDGNGFQILIPEFDARSITEQGGVPEDFYLSITGSTGGANNNHEIDNFQVCALASDPVGQLVHHFEFDYSSSPLTCNAEEMTIRACRNAECDLFTDPVIATLSPASMANGGWVGGNTVNLLNGIAKVSLRSNTDDPVTIGVSSSSPSTVAGSDTLCKQGAGLLNTASCTISFAASGFIFDIPDEFSNKPTTDILVKAVKQDDAGQQCVPAFKNTAKSLAFWSDYVAPSTGTKKVSVKSGSTEEMIGDTEATARAITLNFDSNGKAKIDVNYADAGEVQLNTRYTGTADESGLIMDGSDKFVRRPIGLCVESEACTSCSVTSTKYKRAGEAFDITVKAMAWQSDSDVDICSGNIITPNFTHKNMMLSHNLISPLAVDGGVTGSLGLSEYEQATGEQVIKQSVSEVGIFTFSVTPKVGGYFGYDIPGATTENMGRFTPYYLSVTTVDPEPLPTCGSFTYMDEPFLFKTGAEPRLLVIGKNKDGNETKNYQVEAWWKYINQWTGRSFSNLAGSSLPVLEEIDSGSRSVVFLDGVAGGARSAYLQDGTLRYRRTSTPVAPFDALFELRLSANDLKDIDGICYQESATSAACVGITFEEVALGDDFELRYGRLVLENGYGPETESLRIPIRTEYVTEVSGPTWVVNREDGCSVYNTVSSSDTGETVTTGLNMTFPTGFPALIAYSNPGLTLQGSTTQGGVNQIYFTVPNAAGIVPLKQHVQPWLKGYWNYDGNNANALYDPRASAFFGTYRGHDKVIYWREVN
ncbi:MSHA biogenesis protein MshQ [Shewanella eurypsychrophilus]|uniref:MSHA biogenesis protein MshQ n=1 Tax=Shewanella eurypsychrophilus TaxID=2593656 RepID=A0ABX6VDD3_9GAMM|nr:MULTISPECIES: DUF6701 domain-containing protein [Shewanella]QFU24639.1 MSHA biogenesis protein MshQ [Shewanella sp. YLB-09]QPG59833.1 MSHA biogenesis protein MshQ [Shewanella eurypsychrophilus]